MIKGFTKHFRISDTRPIAAGFTAALALQEGKVLHGRQHRALQYIERAARKRFHAEHLGPAELEDIGLLYNQSAYWHGTGRYQWGGAKRHDALRAILGAGEIIPHLDKYDSQLGKQAVKTISLAKDRLYARCYADMHHQNPEQLNRYIDASQAIGYFVLRPYLRHRYQEAASHPKGILIGRREQHRADKARLQQVGRHWTEKIRQNQVNPMLAFRAGSDIEGNYGVLFGIKGSIRISSSHTAFTETREVRSDVPIALTDVTHIEVPEGKRQEVQELCHEYGLSIPVVAIEQAEVYMSQLPITQILGIASDAS